MSLLIGIYPAFLRHPARSRRVHQRLVYGQYAGWQTDDGGIIVGVDAVGKRLLEDLPHKIRNALGIVAPVNLTI